MSKVIRAYKNGERIATAVFLKSGGIHQVYPDKETFENEAEWRESFDEGVTFQKEEQTVATDKLTLKTLPRHIKSQVSYDREWLTEMQRTVSTLYFQLGLPNSLRKDLYKKHTHGAFKGKALPPTNITNDNILLHDSIIRINPGLYVLTDGLLNPVYFNYRSRRVFFGRKFEATYINTGSNDMNHYIFFKTYNNTYISSEDRANNISRATLEIVKPVFQTFSPTKKVVVYRSRKGKHTYTMKHLQLLMDAGYYVLFHTLNDIYIPFNKQDKYYKTLNDTLEKVEGVTKLIDWHYMLFDDWFKRNHPTLVTPPSA